MSTETQVDEQERDEALPAQNPGYEPPRVDRLGTLAELTKGGIVGPDDGLGGAGDDGSL